jgi:hypothetical protein
MRARRGRITRRLDERPMRISISPQSSGLTGRLSRRVRSRRRDRARSSTAAAPMRTVSSEVDRHRPMTDVGIEWARRRDQRAVDASLGSASEGQDDAEIDPDVVGATPALSGQC